MAKQIQRIVLKLQRPLYTNAAIPFILVYNEDRSFLCELPMTPELLERFHGKEKIYCFAVIDVKDQIELGEEVAEQNW